MLTVPSDGAFSQQINFNRVDLPMGIKVGQWSAEGEGQDLYGRRERGMELVRTIPHR